MSDESEQRDQRTTVTVGINEVEAVTKPDGTMVVSKQKKHGRGPKRELYRGHCMNAALVATVLQEVFTSAE